MESEKVKTGRQTIFFLPNRLIPLLLHRNFLAMRSIYLALAVLLSVFTACSNSNPAANNKTESAQAVKSKLSDSATVRLMTVVNGYYVLKNALVATNAQRADSAASALATTAESAFISLRKDPAGEPLQINMDSIVGNTKVICTIKDETCEKQRLLFDVVSRNMYVILRKTEVKNAHIYQQYCPMAFNEKGAYWLSGESEILNPYFGKKMLECGEVTDSM